MEANMKGTNDQLVRKVIRDFFTSCNYFFGGEVIAMIMVST